MLFKKIKKNNGKSLQRFQDEYAVLKIERYSLFLSQIMNDYFDFLIKLLSIFVDKVIHRILIRLEYLNYYLG